MLTPPADLPDFALRAVLEAGWSLTATALIYLPVGFGSHHWEVTDPTGERRFVTIDDLRTRRLSSAEPLAASFQRLRASLSAAQALKTVDSNVLVAPLPNSEGEPVTRFADFFAVAVYPLVEGETFEWGTYTDQHRRAVLDLVIVVHSAPTKVRDRALRDDYVIPFRDTVTALLEGSLSVDTGLGPYTQPAVELLTSHSAQVRQAFAHYDDLVTEVGAEPGLVLTHGEPHPGNTMRTEDGWLLIDWDTALAAPPERDLWDLDPGDGTLHAAYTAATGVVPRPNLLELYRRRWDLTEIAVCLARFCEPHAETADDAETWTILKEILT